MNDNHERKRKLGALLEKTFSASRFYLRENSRYQDVHDYGLDKLALSLTPPDESRYPTANAAKAFLMRGIRYMQLNSRAMRDPCPATRSTDLELDGTNLARVVGRLIRSANGNHPASQSGHADALEAWTGYLKYALDDLEGIGWAARAPDNAEYIILKYAGGLECPSWLLSDGTLRMLALTLPAFLPASPRIYMVEVPENGVHPKALEIHWRPAISRTESTGCQNRLNRSRSPMLAVPVKSAFSRKGSRSKSVEFGKGWPPAPSACEQ